MLDSCVYFSPYVDRLVHVLAVHWLFQMPTVALTNPETLSYYSLVFSSSFAVPVAYLQVAYLSRLSLIDSTKFTEG